MEQIPKGVVTLGNLKVNGEALKAPAVEAIYPKGVPDYAEAKVSDELVVIKAGTPVEGRIQRNVRLIDD